MSAPNNAAPTAWTIQALIAWTTDFLRKKGVESPRLEAQILLAHAMDCPRIELVARSHEEPTEPQRAAFKDLIRRRVDGWPVAYLVGRREFYLLPFEVAFWIGFALPFGPPLAVVRTVAVALAARRPAAT